MAEPRTGQSARTRHILAETAEQLFALHGVAAVSSRRISKAAGQGNNYAVGHHFGSKNDLISAILQAHNSHINELRQVALSALGPHPQLRDWLVCLVMPQMQYLESLGAPTYFARFSSQVAMDPSTTQLLYDQMAQSSALIEILTGFYDALPPLPEPVIDARNAMTRNLVVLAIAEVERTLEDAADREVSAATSWDEQGEILVDALTGLWLAPVTAQR